MGAEFRSDDELMREIDRLAGVAGGSKPGKGEEDLSWGPELRAAAELARLDWSAESQRRREMRSRWAERTGARSGAAGRPMRANQAMAWAARLALAGLALTFLFASVRLMDPAARQEWATLVARPSATAAQMVTVTREAVGNPPVPALPTQAVMQMPAATPADSGRLPSAAMARLGKGEIQAIAVSAAGQTVAVGSSAGACLYSSVSYAEKWCVSSPGPVLRLAFDPQGAALLATTRGGWIVAWDTVTAKPVFSLQPDGDLAGDAAWAPDGRHFAVILEGEVQVREPVDGSVVQSLSNSAKSMAFAWSPDSKQLAAVDADQKITIWNLASGAVAQSLQPEPPAQAKAQGVYLAWTADGDYLITGVRFSDAGSLDIWSMNTGALETSIALDSPLMALEMAPDSSEFAALLANGTTYVYQTHLNRQRATLINVDPGSTSLAWSADSMQLFYEDLTGEVSTWDVWTNQKAQAIAGYTGPVKDVAWSPDGQYLAVSYVEGQLRLWDPATGTLVRAWEGDPTQSLVLDWKPSADSDLLAVGGDDVVIWNMATGNPVHDLDAKLVRVRALAWSPMGWQIAAASITGKLAVWEANSGQELRVIETGHSLVGVAWSADEQSIAAVWSDGAQNGVTIYAVASGAQVGAWSIGEAVTQVQSSQDGRWVGVLSGGLLQVWDPASRQLMYNLGQDYARKVESFAWSADGKRLASGAGEVYVWDMRSRRQTITLEGQPSGVSGLSFRPDGKQLASGSVDGTVVIWNLTQ